MRQSIAQKGRALRPAFLLLASAAVLSACSLVDPGGNRTNLLGRAAELNWQVQAAKSETFDLFTLRRLKNLVAPLTVYIEGDGRAFLTRERASPDPTPKRPVGLRLALADPAPNFLYLARPCQYAGRATRSPCNPRYWTTARFAPEVIAALSAAIDGTMAELNSRTVELVGYSGGGSAAALVAAYRGDVERLVTIAANLDTELWTRTLGVSPMHLSANPKLVARAIRNIPQIHLIGSDDVLVPPIIGRSFLKSADLPATRHFSVIQGHSHTCCWHRHWRSRNVGIRAALTQQPGS